MNVILRDFQQGVRNAMRMPHVKQLFETLSEDQQIQLFVQALQKYKPSKNTHSGIVAIVDILKYILSDHPQLFMQVADRLDMYDDQYVFGVVPKLSDYSLIPNITKESYKRWYMNICSVAINHDVPSIENVDKSLLRDPEFVTLAVRELQLGPDNDETREEWKTEYDPDVQNFVQNVMALRNLRTTNRMGSQGIAHGMHEALPRGTVEEFLGLKQGGRTKRRRTKRRRTKSKKSKRG